MPDESRLTWEMNRPDLRLPESGLLVETRGESLCGGIGFRPCPEGCELWCEVGDDSADWSGLIERVTAQARKRKYRMATLAHDSALSDRAREALSMAEFTGEPLARPLVCDAPDDLQPYLDWKGRILRVAEGKGREGINARLYERVASTLPDAGKFSEREINAILGELHLYGDATALRRELVDRGYLGRTRDCHEYWKVKNPDVLGRM